MSGFDGTIVTLVDEDGSEKTFEHIDTLEIEGETYAALVPVYDEPQEMLEADGELVILKVILDENGEVFYVTIDDDDEFNRIAEEFEKRFDQSDDFELLH
ncbi:MAG: DUF1292 domain-containing protein [Bacillota bacterium]|nr:DUF1292 domain-containing protein [Bacillota bacterium]